MIATSDRQKRFMIWKGIPGETINVVRVKDVEGYLKAQLDRMPRVPPLQMEFYFEGFNWWWYDDDENLHPNDSDSLPETYVDLDMDDDIPF